MTDVDKENDQGRLSLTLGTHAREVIRPSRCLPPSREGDVMKLISEFNSRSLPALGIGCNSYPIFIEMCVAGN